MAKALKPLVIILLLLSITSLTLGILLFGKREVLKGRTQKLEQSVLALASSLNAAQEPFIADLGVRLNGDAIDEIDERGERITGATLVMLLNAGVEAIPFVLPALGAGERWVTLLDTADPWQPSRSLRARERYELQSRSMAVLRLEGGKRYEEWGPMGVY